MSKTTYKDLIVYSEGMLKEAGIDDYKIDTRLLLEHYFGVDRNFIFIHGDNEAEDEKSIAFKNGVSLRSKRIPLQHIVGYAYFMDYKFKVNENVLIPRQDTEVLVEKAFEIALKIIENKGKVRILDLCTGSGAIAVSLYRMINDLKNVELHDANKKEIEIFASDFSEKALDIAKENAILNKADVTFIKSDLFEDIEELEFDLIVSNPPYIPSKDIEELEPEVKQYDPMMALDGGESGLDFYERIAKDAKLNGKEFHIAFEIGYNQGKDVKNIMRMNGYKNVEILKDLSGNDRVVVADY